MDIKKEDVEALCNRREEIRKEINKLQSEYTAIGNIISAILKNKEIEDDGR